MADLIDRNKLLEVMNEYMQTDLDDFGREDVATAILRQGCKTTIAIVEAVPAVDAEPVQYGEWILRHVGGGHYWECSLCHKNPCIYVTPDTKYCPNCGAKMDTKEDGNDG